MIQESSIPLVPPVVTCSSSTYYWTFPTFYLIGVPAGEPGSLLGISDLAHEFGHLLLETNETLLDDLRVIVNEKMQELRAEAVLAGAPHAADMMVTIQLWNESWLDEFACDVIASYLLGRAFGFQHIRLCAQRGRWPYTPTLGEPATHPADAARMQMILAALTAYGAVDDALAVGSVWDRFIAHQPNRSGTAYDLCYPQELFELIATRVTEAARSLAIVNSLATRAQPDTVAAVLVEAWDRFLTDSRTFQTWEDDALKELYKSR